MTAAAYVGSSAAYSTGAASNAGSRTPAAGNDLILAFVTSGSSAALSGTGVTSSVGAPLIADVPFAVDTTHNFGFGAYRVHGASGGSQTITANFAAGTECYAWLIEASNVASFDSITAAVLSGTTGPLETNPLTPSEGGAFLLAIGAAAVAETFGGWTGGFTALGQRTGGPSFVGAYLDQATAVPAAPSDSLSTNTGWSALILSWIPTAAAGAAFAGTPTAAAVATGVLTTGIELAASMTDLTTATGVMGEFINAAAQDSTAATGALTTGIRLAAAMTATSVLSAPGMTTWSTVVLSGTLYAATGSIVDPNGPWSNGAPGVGDTVYYDGTYLTIETDGEIVATTNDPSGEGLGFSAVCQWDNGGTWSFLVLVVTPWSLGQAQTTSSAIGSLATAIQLAAAVQASFNATALLATSGAGAIASSASDTSAATGAISTGIQLAAALTDGSNALGGLATQIQLAANAIDNVNLAAALDDESLTAPALDTSSATGILNTQINLLGAVATVANAVAALATAIKLQSAAADSSAGAGTLGTKDQLAANATAVSVAQVNLTIGVALNAAAVTATNANAAILTAIRAMATMVDSTTAAGALKTLIRLVGQIQLSSVATGALSSGIAMRAAAQAASQVIAALSTGPRLQIAGAATSSSVADPTLSDTQPIAGAAAAGSTAGASLTTGSDLAAEAAVSSAGSADLFTSIDPDANAVTDSSAIATLGNEGSTLFTADVLIQATAAFLITEEGAQEPTARFVQRVGDRLIYAIDWTGWLAAYWKPNVSVAIGDVIRPWPPNGFQMRCVAPGATGGTPPAWPGFLGSEVLDGEAQWECVALDATSLTANLVGATWSAPQGVLLANQRIAGLLASVIIDTTQASAYTNYDVFCTGVASDGRQRVAKLTICVSSGTAS